MKVAGAVLFLGRRGLGVRLSAEGHITDLGFRVAGFGASCKKRF